MRFACVTLVALLACQACMGGEFETLVAQGKEAVAIRQYQEAEKIFTRALVLRPGHPEALYGAGWARLLQGKLKAAKRYFEDVLKQTYTAEVFKGFHTLALSQLGTILMSQGKYTEALDVYSKGVVNAPNNADLWYGYGTVLRATARNEKALLQFEEALTLEPNHAGALVGKAAVYYDLGNVPEAFNLLRRATEAAPGNPLPYGVMSALYRDLEEPHAERLMLGHYYFYAGDISKAANEYRAALVIRETGEIHHSLGAAMLKLGSLRDADDHFRHALKLGMKPEDATWAQLSLVQVKQGKPDLALASLRKALKLNDKIPTYHTQLAWMYLQTDKIDEAEAAVKQALVLDSDLAVGYRYLGDVYNAKGLAGDAIDAYQKCLARDPGFPDVYVNLGWAYEQKGDLVSAQRNYAIFLRMNPTAEEADSVRAQIQDLKRRGRSAR